MLGSRSITISMTTLAATHDAHRTRHCHARMSLAVRRASATRAGASYPGAVLIMAEIGSYICAIGATVIFIYLIIKG